MVHFSYTFLSVLDSYITVIKEFFHFHSYFGSIARYKIQEGKAHIFRTTEEVERESGENCEDPEVVRTQWNMTGKRNSVSGFAYCEKQGLFCFCFSQILISKLLFLWAREMALQGKVDASKSNIWSPTHRTNMVEWEDGPSQIVLWPPPTHTQNSRISPKICACFSF